jgi:hypothetical protein
VSHPHPVQSAVDRAVGYVEVSVPVDVDDTESLNTIQKAGHRADTNRAVAPEDHDDALAWSRSDEPSDLAGAVDDRADVRCPRTLRVRTPPKRAYPAAAVHHQASRFQPLD